jgi:hypothetical protein
MTLPMPGALVAEWVKTMGCPLPAALAPPRSRDPGGTPRVRPG